MALKLFRAVWFLSVLVVMANLLYVYASLPETVIFHEPDGQSISREWFFYTVVICVVVVNFLVYLLKILFAEGENLRSWFHGLIITINIFIIVAMHALKIYNSSEIFDQSRVGIFVAGSIGLIILWAALWPLYLVFQKFFDKQLV